MISYLLVSGKAALGPNWCVCVCGGWGGGGCSKGGYH